jgi:radical SAM protein with 4Fe4S-binding SPASM domain
MLKRLLHNAVLAMRGLAAGRIDLDCDGIHYRYRGVPLRKAWNWLLAEAGARWKPGRPWAWPTHLQVEPTNLCNLHCALCPVTEGMGRPSGMMELALFERLMEEIGDYVFLILLWDWGEPLVHPGLHEIVACAKRRDIRVACSTNGHSLVDPAQADRVILSGLDTLIFAVDGTTQETYQRYRSGGDLAAALRGIRTVLERRRALNRQTPLVNLRFIVMKHNEHEVPGLPELARSLGVDVLTLKTLNPSFALADPKDGDSPFIPANPRYRRFRYEPDGRTRVRLRENPCKNPWNTAAVHWDGTVCLCTFDSRERWPMGKLREAAFREIWRGPDYRKLREQFRRDWQSLASCKDCSYAFVGGSLARDTIAEALHLTPSACAPCPKTLDCPS